MATTFDGTGAINTLIDATQDALDNKVNAIDIAAESDGVRIKNAKLSHEEIKAEEVSAAWQELSE